MKIKCLQPLIDENSRILILGSMPGVQSLQKRQYYGNQRNYFWRILFEIFAEEYTDDYEQKIGFLKRHGIALFDTIAECRRKGSLDSNIKEEKRNDIDTLLENHPGIRLIVLNGSKAASAFRSGNTEITVLRLPSTSPVPRRDYRNFDDVFQKWKEELSPYL